MSPRLSWSNAQKACKGKVSVLTARDEAPCQGSESTMKNESDICSHYRALHACLLPIRHHLARAWIIPPIGSSQDQTLPCLNADDCNKLFPGCRVINMTQQQVSDSNAGTVRDNGRQAIAHHVRHDLVHEEHGPFNAPAATVRHDEIVNYVVNGESSCNNIWVLISATYSNRSHWSLVIGPSIDISIAKRRAVLIACRRA